MTDLENAERLRREYLKNPGTNVKMRNICNAIPHWDGCDYCDVYAGVGLDCWKQGKRHDCCKALYIEAEHDMTL